MSPSVFIHSLSSTGSFGRLGMFVCGWFCMLVISGCKRQLVSWVVNLMVFLMIWYVDSFFYSIFFGVFWVGIHLVCLFD